jgi:virginiamycin B lyase
MKQLIRGPRAAAGLVLALAASFAAVASRGQMATTRGSLSGTVTVDQGNVVGFRVTVHNLTYRLWYTVFTVKGHYTVPQALPGSYDVLVLEKGFTSPTMRVDLAPGEDKTVDVAVKRVAATSATQGASTEGLGAAAGVPGAAANTVWVDSMDQLYPPGPGRDLLKANCTGCHGPEFGTMHRTKDGFRSGIARMTETGPTDNPFDTNLGHTYLTGAQKNQIAEYLATNFGPGTPDKRLKVDPPILDEDALAKAIYVSYDIPDNFPRPAFRGNLIGANEIDGVTAQDPWVARPDGRPAPQLLHDPFIVPDGVWYANPVANAMVHLDPTQVDPGKRYKVYPLKGPETYVFMHGITVDRKGHVYWAEITGGQLGELDPDTGKQIRHYTPRRGGMLQVVTDKDDNVWFAMVKGPGGVGKLDATTRVVHQWQTPTPDNLLYGLAANPVDGTIWGAGYDKGLVTGFDPKAEEYHEYYAPSSWGQIRRIGVDSKGIVWFSEYTTGFVGRLDPATGKMTEYKMPTQGANPYEVWPDKTDKIWISDQPQGSLVHFDPDTKKWTYYPEPQLNWSLPKVEVEKNNTIWFGARFLPYITANHFYPTGYSADAPPEP